MELLVQAIVEQIHPGLVHGAGERQLLLEATIEGLDHLKLSCDASLQLRLTLGNISIATGENQRLHCTLVRKILGVVDVTDVSVEGLNIFDHTALLLDHELLDFAHLFNFGIGIVITIEGVIGRHGNQIRLLEGEVGSLATRLSVSSPSQQEEPTGKSH